MVRTQAGDTSETARQGSLSRTLEIWTSTAGAPTELQGVADGSGGVSERSRVDHNPISARSEVDCLHELAFVIRLEEGRLDPERSRPFRDLPFQVVEGGRAVDLGLTAPEQVEIWPIEDDNLHHATSGQVLGDEAAGFLQQGRRQLARDDGVDLATGP